MELCSESEDDEVLRDHVYSSGSARPVSVWVEALSSSRGSKEDFVVSSIDFTTQAMACKSPFSDMVPRSCHSLLAVQRRQIPSLATSHWSQILSQPWCRSHIPTLVSCHWSQILTLAISA